MIHGGLLSDSAPRLSAAGERNHTEKPALTEGPVHGPLIICKDCWGELFLGYLRHKPADLDCFLFSCLTVVGTDNRKGLPF